MKIIHNKIIPFGKNFIAINLFGVLFTKAPLDRVMINHEKIHTAQMKELLYVPFYIIYFIEWLARFIIKGSSINSYYSISFEREAYDNMHDMSYLSSRKKFSFLKYFKK